MLIKVAGMDPSFRNWGLSSAMLDLDTGQLTADPTLALIETGLEKQNKLVRMNSVDLQDAETLFKGVYPFIKDAKAIFVEVPHGSQSASAMKGYGVCIGVLGCIRALGIQIIEVSEMECKMAFVGDRKATKKQTIQHAVDLYPSSNWPTHAGKISEGKAEHMADSVAAIHAGVKTPVFQNLMRLLKAV